MGIYNDVYMLHTHSLCVTTVASLAFSSYIGDGVRTECTLSQININTLHPAYCQTYPLPLYHPPSQIWILGVEIGGVQFLAKSPHTFWISSILQTEHHPIASQSGARDRIRGRGYIFLQNHMLLKFTGEPTQVRLGFTPQSLER